jgi:hypothetical protein
MHLMDSKRCGVCLIGALALAAACGDDGSQGDAAAMTQACAKLAVSASHGCAIRSGGLYCWGQNFAGQLGDATMQDSQSAVLASAVGEDVAEVGVASGRGCVRRHTGEVACWGTNDQGQIGDGTRMPSLQPVVAHGLDDAAQIAVGEASTCALRARDQSVVCWGYSPESAPDRGFTEPTPIDGLSAVVELRAGSQGTYCARDRSDRVHCWTFEHGAWTAPKEVPALAGASALGVTGMNEVCAIAKTKQVVCYSLDHDVTDVLPDSDDSLKLTAAGAFVACALNTASKWHCWNVGPAAVQSSLSVPTDMPVGEIEVAGLYGCALLGDQSVACLDAAKLTAPPTDALPPLTPVAGLPL